jgi:hypothetical protein
MFAQQVIVLRNIFVVEICNPEIQEDIEQERKIEQGNVISIYFSSDCDLHVPVNTQYPERLDQQVQGKDQEEISYKFALHRITKRANVIHFGEIVVGKMGNGDWRMGNGELENRKWKMVALIR